MCSVPWKVCLRRRFPASEGVQGARFRWNVQGSERRRRGVDAEVEAAEVCLQPDFIGSSAWMLLQTVSSWGKRIGHWYSQNVLWRLPVVGADTAPNLEALPDVAPPVGLGQVSVWMCCSEFLSNTHLEDGWSGQVRDYKQFTNKVKQLYPNTSSFISIVYFLLNLLGVILVNFNCIFLLQNIFGGSH